jgi:hypothetical protein
MVQLSATRCNCIAILWVSLVIFSAITLCVSSQWVFVVVVLFRYDSVRKLLDNTSSYSASCLRCMISSLFLIRTWYATRGSTTLYLKVFYIFCWRVKYSCWNFITHFQEARHNMTSSPCSPYCYFLSKEWRINIFLLCSSRMKWGFKVMSFELRIFTHFVHIGLYSSMRVYPKVSRLSR